MWRSPWSVKDYRGLLYSHLASGPLSGTTIATSNALSRSMYEPRV
jgi:hypothetical protein